MTSTDCHSLIVIDGTDKVQNVIVVIKWFSNTHNNDMANTFILTTFVKILLNKHNLSYNFSVIEVTLLLDQT